jgi:hypothetical protein
MIQNPTIQQLVRSILGNLANDEDSGIVLAVSGNAHKTIKSVRASVPVVAPLVLCNHRERKHGRSSKIYRGLRLTSFRSANAV